MTTTAKHRAPAAPATPADDAETLRAAVEVLRKWKPGLMATIGTVEDIARQLDNLT